MNSVVGSLIPETIITQLPAMSAAEAICTLVLANATYGCGKQWARLTYADFQQRTMFNGTATIARALKAVSQRGFFCRQPEGSVWEIAEHANVELDNEPEAESQTDVPEAVSFFAEDTSLSEERTSLSEEDTSLSEEDTSLFEASSRARSIDCPESEPDITPGGPEIEPLPYNKEKDLRGKVRERRRKKSAREESPATELQGGYHAQIPRPRTADEGELAEHPATAVWLEAGFSWPGWERLRTIARRMGRHPQPAKLRQAREQWLMAGYRIGNIGGILDWYEQICRDSSWRPFYATSGHTGPVAAPQEAGAGPPPDPTMAMLLQMQEDLANGKHPDYHRMFGFAQSSLSQDGVQPAVGCGIPASPG